MTKGSYGAPGAGVPVIDLFAGAGGFSLGVVAAGGDVRLMVDLDPISCETLMENLEHHRGLVLEADVLELSGADLRALAGLTRTEPLVIVGGAPCQPFSKAAYWTDPGTDAAFRRARARGQSAPKPVPITEARPDRRRSLVGEFLRLIAETRAEAFIFENVPSITHPRNRQLLLDFLTEAESLSFRVTWFRANAAEFGVPQLRERVFVLGSRAQKPLPPHPTYSKDDVPALDSQPVAKAGPALAPYAGLEFHEPEEVVSGRWAQHLEEIPPGSNYKHHTEWAGHPSPTFETETRFWNFLLKLSPDLPSWTIPASPGPWTGPFHWESRRLRTPELAALQTFPRGYKFSGSRRERVRQIGNAIPVLLAQRVAEQVLPLVASRPCLEAARQ